MPSQIKINKRRGKPRKYKTSQERREARRQANKEYREKMKEKRIEENHEKISKKLENMLKQIEESQTKQREEIRKQHDELIKIASESKKKSVSKDTQDLDRTDTFIRRGYIKLKDPEDKEAFNQRLNLALQRPINNEVKKSDNTEPYTVYSLNKIRFWDDVNKFIDEIYDKTPKAFKIRFTFNGIYETSLNGEVDYREDTIWEKDIFNLSKSFIIKDYETKNEFKRRVKSFVNEVRQNITKISTKWQLICIHRLEFRVYRLRKMGRYLPELEMYVKSHSILVPTSDDLFCWDHCGVMFQMVQNNEKIKQYHVYKKGRYNGFKRIFNKEPNTNSKEYRDFIKTYEGFNIATCSLISFSLIL